MNKAEMMDKILEKIEKENLEKAFEKINNIVVEVFEENDEDVFGLEEIIEHYIDSLQVKPMHIENVYDAKEDKHCLQIETPNSEGEYECTARYEIKGEDDNPVVNLSMIMKLREMAWLGYRLKQSKEWTEKNI